MKNTTHTIFSIVKKLEVATFKTLKIGNSIEKAKKKLLTLNAGTVLYANREKRIEELYKQLENSLDISNIETDIFKRVSYSSFQHGDVHTVRRCNKIFNGVENGYYTHKQFVIAYMYESLFVDKKISIKLLTLDRIKEIKKLFTRKRYGVDKEFIISINESLNITKISEYFKINNDGENIIFTLIKKRFISPIFYLYLYKKTLTRPQENINLKSKEYLHFERLNNIIFKFLN